jgi:hypothetical protein
MIYTVIHSIIGFFSIFTFKRKYDNLIKFILFFGLFIFIGFRYQVGADWSNYLEISKSIGQTDLSTALLLTDPAYGYLNFLGNLLNLNIWFSNSICALILLLGLFKLILVYGKLYFPLFISFSYIIVIVGMGVTRQAAALGFVFLAFVYIKENNTRNMLLSLFAAVLFHKAAFFISLILLFIKFLDSKKIGLIMMISLIFVLVGGLSMHTNLMNIYYFYNEELNESRGAVIRSFYFFCIAIFAILWRNFLFINPQEKKIVLILSNFILIIAPLVFIMPVIIDRFLIFFWPLVIIFYARIDNSIKILSISSKIIKLIMIAINLIYFNYWILYSNFFEEYWSNYNNYIFL